MQPDTLSLGGGVAVTLDRPRVLRLNFNALVKLGEVTGKNPLEPDFWGAFDPARMRAVLWAALLHEDPSLTLDQAGELFDTTTIREIGAALTATIRLNMTRPHKSAPPAPAAVS